MPPDELGPWKPLRRAEVIKLFRLASFRWWLAGGHALELHFGRTWRSHEDIDVGIVRADAPRLTEVLAGWDIHRAHNGILTPWDGGPLAGEFESVGNLWCRPTPSDAWSLDVLVGGGDEEEWIYRRDTTLRRPWGEAVCTAPGGIPYLAPEIQLLFKSKSIRPKDDIDAAEVIPQLSSAQRAWLGRQLRSDHPWQTIVAASG